MTRLLDFAVALRQSRALLAREREPFSAFQQQRFDTLVEHARRRSPFYRDWDGAPLDKATMMEHFDAIVTDPRLRRDERYLGDYRVMTTSGSSGLKGLFVYDRAGWTGIMAQFLRYSATVGIEPRFPRRLRIGAVVSPTGTHMSRRCASAVDVGVHRVLGLAVTQPLREIVSRLNAFQPQSLNTFPTMALELAEEQRAGRLRIAPELISTSSELLTPEMADRIEETWCVRPYSLYATTEGLWGVDCEHHAGIHLFEDMVRVENVDEHGRAVPDGAPGAKLLVPNLFNFVQPLLRLEIADAVTIAAEPCACGRTLRRLESVAGRAHDVLELGDVRVQPLHFGVIARDRDVVEFQVVQTGPSSVRVLVVARGDVQARLRERCSNGCAGWA
ncbi:phenylacetate--CoA ligase family protein [Solirubrobacter sp. CPCC 204708]|uniref:Phenylacetate--CoA ligase family protein n=1 Tax=Solirubrobacter deserti TaxID=2282478 RepID=A0ABT4RRB1_9ACTN|nr:phenylacetate--CoA ligase family protein [Solirubrobacter deserti]MBE2320713.1 phenylacetate--CoA ligase family protein [Solirubrobacter deserti]MDA0140938.1 phenylacetate--CoA ligase family protein [Solirubrobacter deserti]